MCPHIRIERYKDNLLKRKEERQLGSVEEEKKVSWNPRVTILITLLCVFLVLSVRYRD